ncbi:xanthine dehydrogenase family protein subunit M [Actinomadura sp. LD22]|uniref:Xanthine dehydrogenase family protein subunit M n=1 Tax=Actinomadura physcomitrii TaxID=2650748 RepID=A0A6I4M5W9_9ACTN|nr:xanthine dehydrogenase family protein subunit M [Actinomadura physcomitrii]MWA00952.1 xanthine dehydrogenase family protein subunit M [Actinomadura physcomitrii]
MKPAPFGYHAPADVAEATALLSELGDDAKVLAGGQSLVPMMALRLARPEQVVDVNRVAGLGGVRRENGTLVVGATTRHVALERDPVVAAAVPLLARAAPYIGHFQIRNRGTLGGSLAHADAAAELPAVARALDAEFELAGPDGTRRVAAAAFFRTLFTTALEPDELLVAVRFPIWRPRSGFAVAEVARRHGDFALAGAVCGVQVDAGRISRVAIGLIGMGSVPLRAEAVERSLTGSEAAALDLDDVGAQAVAGTDPPSDVHAGTHYRAKVGAALVARALSTALKEADHG